MGLWNWFIFKRGSCIAYYESSPEEHRRSCTHPRTHMHTFTHGGTPTDLQGGSHGLYLLASPSLIGVTLFLMVLLSDTEPQGLILLGKGMALFAASQSSSALWHGPSGKSEIGFVIINKKTTSTSWTIFQSSPPTWGFASPSREIKVPRMPHSFSEYNVSF